ncbi:hypothetical protein GQ42DRAFT_170693 [Ramicandelaber brevisporus]|nr:hypothetical protein GQ42DRAFT_170693 [Ramicandelaber brevisporus]
MNAEITVVIDQLELLNVGDSKPTSTAVTSPKVAVGGQDSKASPSDSHYHERIHVCSPSSTSSTVELAEVGTGVLTSVNGINVQLPSDPTPSQHEILNALVPALLTGSPAMIETLPGSDTTVALLSGTLAWQQQHIVGNGINSSNISSNFDGDGDGQTPRIIYCTHSVKQANQVAKELRENCLYKPRAVILASRDSYCVNDEVRAFATGSDYGDGISGGSIRAKCLIETACGNCMPHLELQQQLAGDSGKPISPYSQFPELNQVLDIEQLFEFSSSHNKWSTSSSSSSFSSTSSTASSKSSGVERSFTGCSSNPNALCGYYLARSMATTPAAQNGAEIVIATYPYVMDMATRKATELDLSNAVVIIDNAQNAADALRKSLNIELTDVDMAIIRQWAAMAKERMVINGYNNVGSFETIRLLAVKLLSIVDYGCVKLGHSHGDKDDASSAAVTAVDDKGKGDTMKQPNSIAFLDATGIADVLTAANIDSKFLDELKTAIAMARGMSKVMSQVNVAVQSFSYTFNSFGELEEPVLLLVEKLFHILSAVVDTSTRDHFAITVQPHPVPPCRRDTAVSHFAINSYPIWSLLRSSCSSSSAPTIKSVLRIDCLSAEAAFAPIVSSAHSVILTGSTLSPMKETASELGHKFSHCVSVHPAINSSLVWVGQLSHAPDETKLNLSSRIKWERSKMQAIGETLLDVVVAGGGKVPGGALVFFPSHGAIEMVEKCWRDTGLMSKMGQTSYIMIEPRDPSPTQMTKFINQLRVKIKSTMSGKDSKSGCLVLAVCRGRLVENANFPAELCRAIVMVGVPFARLRSPIVNLKIQYNNRQRKSAIAAENTSNDSGMPCVSGFQWYAINAFRVVNQTLGLGIRNGMTDRCALILMDSRYGESKYTARLSPWIVDKMVRFNSTKDASESLLKFITEGVDFPDDMCRAVVIVGVPMASLESPGVTLKIRYNDRRHQDTKNKASKKGSDGSDIPYISGDQWYRTDAYRAVNQALGRSVRHSKDWGAMYLIETRYTDPKNSAYLSGWIKDSFIRFTSAKAASNDLTQFLKSRQG